MLRSSTGTLRRTLRPGFTLVELMVMAAVCVLIMSILASVFQTGIDAIRHVRAQGEMMDQLRSAGEVIKHDLNADHFLPDSIPNRTGERRRLSDYRFDLGDPGPRGGYFFMSSPISTIEGTDAVGLTSTRATNHVLQFTSVTSGNIDTNHFAASLTAGTVMSPAAEVAYFLVPDPGQSTAGAPGFPPQQLFLLIRRQRLVAMNGTEAVRIQSSAAGDPSPTDLISLNGSTVNQLTDLLIAAKRLTSNSRTSVNRPGEDILLSNVLSFEVKALTNTPTSFPGGDTDFPYVNIPTAFDTSASPTFRIRSLQIRIRVYDTKMQMARQSTFIVDM